jgi:hypothetical protein
MLSSKFATSRWPHVDLYLVARCVSLQLQEATVQRQLREHIAINVTKLLSSSMTQPFFSRIGMFVVTHVSNSCQNLNHKMKMAAFPPSGKHSMSPDWDYDSNLMNAESANNRDFQFDPSTPLFRCFRNGITFPLAPRFLRSLKSLRFVSLIP